MMNSVRVIFLALCGFGAWIGAAGGASAQIAALGASNTQGNGVGSSAAYPAQLEGMLRAKGASARVVNAGVSGDTTEGMLGRLSSAVPEGTRVVIVQYGGNDARRGILAAKRQSNIASIEGQLRARKIEVVRADGYVGSALGAGMAQPDHIHLSAQGHQWVAAQLLPAVQ